MESIWFTADLAEEIMKNDDILQQTQSVVTDIITGRLDITAIIENMGAVLTNKDAENRLKGMRFFTKILKEMPKEYFSAMQLKFISKFYIDRLKDNHKVIPSVLEGYLAIIEMKNYNMDNSAEFLTIMFREVPCQSQLRQDRTNIYLLIQQLMKKDIEYMKSLGPDFVYGFISAMDGERDPRNLLFLFNLLPRFIRNIPLGHLVEEMFEVISCYYPIDFHPSPDDPEAVSRQQLAAALAPCLCASSVFGEQCLVLLLEKLDSSLRLAKIDSLKLLTESCKTFTTETYTPFLKALWSSVHRELSHKTDEELRMAAYEALSALVSNLSTSAHTDLTFENFVKGIVIAMQTAIAESSTVMQFVQATKVLLTTANSSKESCIIITKSMIPATITFYGFKTSSKLQIASLYFIGDMYELAKHWDVLDEISVQVKEIPQLCLTAVSQTGKEYKIAGFKTLIRCKDVLDTEIVLPFIEVSMYTIQHSQDNDLLSLSVETVNIIGRKYPELVMEFVVKKKCDLENLTRDKHDLEKRLNLLSNLASIDEFSKVIISEMLNVITANDEEASKIVEALNESISNADLYPKDKVDRIESDHGLIESILSWLLKEIKIKPKEQMIHGFNLISNTISNLSIEKQQEILAKHTQKFLEMCKVDTVHFLLLECLYNSLHQSVYSDDVKDILKLSLNTSLNDEDEYVRIKACTLVAHFLNKAEYGMKFEFLYELLKDYLTSCHRDETMCPRLIVLYGWITKGLIMRGSDLFSFWLQKIMVALSSSEYCKNAAESIQLIMTESQDNLSQRQHCRIGLLYRQRMFQTFSAQIERIQPVKADTKEFYLLSWAYVLRKTPKSVLNNEVNKIVPIVIDSLNIDNEELLLVMTEVLSEFIETKYLTVGQSLQTIMPRLVKLTKYVKSMDVRIKSLQCLYNIANVYPTVLLLPYKQDMLIDLTPSLDDKKRLVRNMAVKARTRWFLIGSPGEQNNQ